MLHKHVQSLQYAKPCVNMKFLSPVSEATMCRKSIWTPALAEAMVCEIEFGNIHDPYAVAAHKPSTSGSSQQISQEGIKDLKKPHLAVKLVSTGLV